MHSYFNGIKYKVPNFEKFERLLRDSRIYDSNHYKNPIMHMLRRQLSFHLFNHTNHAKINRFMEVNFFAGVGGYVDSTEIGKCEAAVN